MARKEADLTLFMLVSDYNPAHYYNRTKNKLAALGDCKTLAEVMKKDLEDNGIKVIEMYVIEHKGEKTADSKSKEYHRGIDETKLHYHIVVKFESKQATLKEIAKYISVRPEIIEKPKQGRYSYDNMLSYLTHIKYEDKTQYVPEDVVTIVGTDYMDYYNKRKESWIKARAIVAKKGGKPLGRLFQEAVTKLKKGEISYDDLCDIEEYDRLRLEPTYRKKLICQKNCVSEKALEDYYRLLEKISNKEITSLEEITANKKWKLACMYCQEKIEITLQLQKSNLIKQN